MSALRVTGLRTERLVAPLAIDVDQPRFGWRIESTARGARQAAYRVIVETGDLVVWDSGRVVSDRSQDVLFGSTGTPATGLTPETVYRWRLAIEDEGGRTATAEADFRTGLAGHDRSAWRGAEWIGAERPHLDSASLVVWRIRARVRVAEGSSVAGFVLGANDFRLRNAVFNEYGLAGDNHVAVLLDVAEQRLRIVRAGYGPGDGDGRVIVEIGEGSNVPELLPVVAAHAEHEIEIVCWSSVLQLFIDGVEVQDRNRTRFVVNPRGDNDVPSFPNLAEVGFVAGPGERFAVAEYEIRTFRAPEALLLGPDDLDVFREAPGVTLDGGVLHIDGGQDGVLTHRDPSHDGVPVLRRTFRLEHVPARAILSITARGVFEVEVNGKRVGDGWFDPGAGEYRKTIDYAVHDVTALLQPGRNVVLVRLAGGWWSDMVSFLRVNTGFYGDRPSMLADLLLEEADGGRRSIVSAPGGWQVRTDGPIRNGSFFQGERYDARLEPHETAETGWRGAVVVAPMERFARPELHPKRDESVRVVERRTGALIGETRPGSDAWLYDMGVNMVGVPEVDLDLPAGRTIVLRTAEMRYPDLPAYREQGLDGLLMTENLREAMSTDVYITAGGPRSWHPRFTFHGYRYLEISGTAGPLPAGAVRGLVLSSVEPGGDVTTSDPMLNTLMRNIQRSQTGNFLSIPTDCPQRNERLGWLEAVTEFARTSMFTSDAALFTDRFLQLVRESQVDEQLLREATDPLRFHEEHAAVLAVEDGTPRALFTAPPVVGMYPSYVPGFDAYRSWGTPWSSAGVLVPYELYRHYGSLDPVRRSFDSMRRYLVAMESLRLPGCTALSADGGSCGDWLSLDKPTYLYTDATVYAWSLACFAEMAAAIGEDAVAAEYTERSDAARREWNDRFIDPADGRLRRPEVGESQSACVLALAYDLPYPEYRPAVEAALCAAVERGWDGAPFGITTGLFTTPLINLVLSDIGRSDLAYAMIENRAFPSWLYPVAQGATSIWERWNSFTEETGFASGNAMNSFNHFSLGGVGAWLFNRVVGIDRDPASPGMQHVLLHPVPGGSLTTASGWTRTDHGVVEAAWQRDVDGEEWTYSVRLPANTSATIDLPWAGDARFEVGAGAWRVVVADGAAVLSEA